MKKLKSLYYKAAAKATTFVSNISGSETTEKIGMVVVAVVVVGLLATAMTKAMPNLFNTIMKTATDKLTAIFNP